MINLSAEGKIRPDEYILRDELAFAFNKYLTRHADYLKSIGFTEDRQTISFYDVPTSSRFYEDIQNVSELGIINGYTSTFGPRDSLTREQLCTVFLNFLLKLQNGYVKR